MTNHKQSPSESGILERASAVMPQASLGNLPYEVIIKRGKGSHIWDESGNEYIDYLLGSGPMIVGHSNQVVIDAVKAQLEDGSTFFATNEKSVALAEEIVKAVPC
ncbi:aminotransferase class III-fold pyridoxal phosphate-dependent enzyme, partial [SAR202 cluster bacterium AC-647-P02_OGT_505m]|nr:aminotransferase class III-fold pyridoxal phosphate-dependent enzyme [SAR202 cluster bacterium AC-647-P02_OGT_505m]